MKSDFLFLFICVLFISTPLHTFSQSEKKEIRQGNDEYKTGKFSEAEISYRKALEKSSTSFSGNFNLGNSLYKQDKNEEALRYFENSVNSASGNEKKAAALHNLGNTYLKNKKYQEAVDKYKESLRLNPGDKDTRYNLAYAQNMIQKQQQNEQEKQNNKQDDTDNQEQKDQQKDKEKDQQKDKQKDQQNDEQKDKNESDTGNDEKNDNNKEDQQSRSKDGGKISKEEAERMLKALQNKEQELQKKLQKKEGERIRIEKQW